MAQPTEDGTTYTTKCEVESPVTSNRQNDVALNSLEANGAAVISKENDETFPSETPTGDEPPQPNW